MLNQNIKSNNLSDCQSTINVIQFEYQHYFDTMIEHFINSSDASRVFSDYFEKAHRRMHEILDYNYSKQLSAYIQLNNITNSKKELLSSYKTIGFNGIFGVSYSF